MHFIEKDEWFLKDKEEWTEDNGNTFVSKTHREIQKEYLNHFENPDIIDETKYLYFIQNGTKELSSKETENIKAVISNVCKLKSLGNKKHEKQNDHKIAKKCGNQ
jgi:hypothetical protein